MKRQFAVKSAKKTPELLRLILEGTDGKDFKTGDRMEKDVEIRVCLF